MTVETDTMSTIDALEARKHRLRAQSVPARVLSAEAKQELAALDAQLDACWALLRQRRSSRYFHRDPDTSPLEQPLPGAGAARRRPMRQTT